MQYNGTFDIPTYKYQLLQNNGLRKAYTNCYCLEQGQHLFMTDRHTFINADRLARTSKNLNYTDGRKSQPLSFFVFDHSERFDIGTSWAKWFVIDRNSDRQAGAWLSD